ncbi:hypothetical protein niasHT_003116 [Heterodera trifolii]|uniref:Uncharacterized protein n=1 Tax=Heterodera trifolii TaxID=157864 RepID=A0ABD2M4X5_9BILA
MSNSGNEAKRKRKEWRQERAQKGGSTPKSPRQTTEAPSTTGEGTSTEIMPSTSNAEPSHRSNPRPLSTTPIRRHVRVRPTTTDKTTGTDFRAAVQSTQTVLETVETATQTETEQESIQRLCAELNKAKRRIETLERQLEKKTDEVKRLKKRPTEKHRHRLKRVSSLDDLSRQSRTTRAKEIARDLSHLFRPGTPVPEIDKIVRQARHQANFISPQKLPGKWTKKGRTRKQERISPILDIQVTLMLGFSWRQRQQLKNTLINMRDDGTAGGGAQRRENNDAMSKTQEYTGDHMKRLLLASTEIRSIGTPFSIDIADLLDEVRELHIFGRADLLTPEQITDFSNKCLGIHGYFKKLWETYPTEFDTNNAVGFTPKLHWLLAHGPEFARRWGWFAWISEQGIEHLHHVLNKQSERFMRYKGDELLLKIGEHQTLLNSIFDRQIGFL